MHAVHQELQEPAVKTILNYDGSRHWSTPSIPQDRKERTFIIHTCQQRYIKNISESSDQFFQKVVMCHRFQSERWGPYAKGRLRNQNSETTPVGFRDGRVSQKSEATLLERVVSARSNGAQHNRRVAHSFKQELHTALCGSLRSLIALRGFQSNIHLPV